MGHPLSVIPLVLPIFTPEAAISRNIEGMRFLRVGILVWIALVAGARVAAQSSSSSSSSKHTKGSSARAVQNKDIDDGAVVNGVYRNKALALACKIPEGWVLRTEEMNSREEDGDEKPSPQGAQRNTENGGRVLLAAFSRPPEAKGEEVNSSILVTAEPVAAYPGLTDAAQYFGPLTEVAKAQGFEEDEEPYEFAAGTKKVVRADFHKDVGSRVMRQSTLAFLSHGYALSITVIGGREDEVEGLVDGMSFAGK
ncbi:MAG TPA: hypothetical protein VE866_04445 [Candidatus Binatia bacterium]|jgi:hypothetical protein|nr:hypothetical protein [Candidatus Binatia bacterium]